MAAWLKQVIIYIKQAAYVNCNTSPFAAFMPCPSKPEYPLLLQLSSEGNAWAKLKIKTQFLLSFVYLLERAGLRHGKMGRRGKSCKQSRGFGSTPSASPPSQH